MTELSSIVCEHQQIDLLRAGIAAGQTLRAQKVQAYKDGIKPLDFNELRELDMNIAKCKHELELML